jgi:hypothetical protein
LTTVELKPGSRYRSQVCETEVIIVRPLPGDVALTCGGAPLIDIKAEPDASLTLDSDQAGGTALGKRYTDPSGALEILVTKPGQGALAIDGVALEFKETKPLPASD